MTQSNLPLDNAVVSDSTQAENFQHGYKAFISYSHSNNREQGRKWADWLHHSLETYEIPKELVGKPNQHGQPIPAQIYPIFQDEKELSANNDLSASLEQALQNSEFLIYLSSPNSARSVYVQEEIKFFKKMGRADKIIALIVAGEPEYGDTQTENQCFPDALRYDVSPTGEILYDHHAEALAADVRLPNTSEEGFTSVEGYRRFLQAQNTPNEQIKELTTAYEERLNLAKLKIISTILGVPLRELTKRDKAYQLERARHKTKIVQRVAGAIGVLALLATGSGVYAWQQKNEALKNYSQTLYASGINKLAQNEYGDPAAYIAAAVRNDNKNATELAESMLAIRDDMGLLQNLQSMYVKFSPSGRYIVGYADMGNNSHILQLWDADTRKKIADVLKLQNRDPREVYFDNNDNLYAVNEEGQVIRYIPSDGKGDIIFTPTAINPTDFKVTNITLANAPNVSSNNPPQVASSVNATSVASNNETNPASTAATTSTTAIATKPKTNFGYGIKNVSPDGKWLALFSYDDKRLEIVSTVDPKNRHIFNLPAGSYPSVEFPNPYKNSGVKTTTPMAVIYGTEQKNQQSYMMTVDLSQNTPVVTSPVINTGEGYFDVIIDDSGKHIMLKGPNKNYQLYDVVTGTLTPLKVSQNYYKNFIFNPDGKTIVGIYPEGYDIYQVNNGDLISENKSPMKNFAKYLEKPMTSFSYSPDMTQELTEKNKLLYLRNDYGNPLIINEYNYPANYSKILPTQEGDKLFLLSKDKLQIDSSDVATGKLVPSFIKLTKPIVNFEVLKNNRLMTIDGNQTLTFYDTQTGKQIGQPLTTKAKFPNFNEDQTQVIARTGEDSLSVWQIADGKLITSYQNPKMKNFRTDDTGQYLIFTEDKTWEVINLTDKTTVLTGTGKINNAVFSKEGQLLAVGSEKGEVQVYDLKNKKQKFVIPSISTPLFKFTPNGKALLASTNNRRMQFFDTDTGKAYGQIISVAPDTKILEFDKEGTKLFLQDMAEDNFNPSVKIIDVATGNLISLPFATDTHTNIQLVDNQHKLITSSRDIDSQVVTVWQVPTGLNIPKEQLANDLETFYGRKYDPDTGTIMPYDGKREFKTWFFQDIYTRTVSPDSKTSIIETLQRYIPIQNEQQLKTLSTVYFYHPLARAGLAEYYSRKPETAAISERLIALTSLQMQHLTAKNGGSINKTLIDVTNQQLAKAKQQLNQSKNQPITMPVATSEKSNHTAITASVASKTRS